MSYSLILIDELLRSEHSRLQPDDECYYMIEYHAKKGFSYSNENQLIYNLKKKMDKRGLPEWKHKGLAIHSLADYLASSLQDYVLNLMTFVPVPTSKRKDNELYDDRLLQILGKIATRLDNFHFEELIINNANRDPSHASADGSRLSIEELSRDYEIDFNATAKLREVIVLFDDVVTAGTHFKVCKELIRRNFPDKDIIGIFLARTIHHNPLPEEFALPF